MDGPILDSTKKHFPKFVKKMKWWIIGGFFFFLLNGLNGAEGDFVIFLYKFLPSFIGFSVALILVYYFKYSEKKNA